MCAWGGRGASLCKLSRKHAAATIALLCIFSAAQAGLGALAALSPAEQAGEALAQGRSAEAVSLGRRCIAEPGTEGARCQLVLARALFAQNDPAAAAQALGSSTGALGELTATGAELKGEALLLSGGAPAALAPLRAAAALDPDGPPGLRAYALLAEALLASGQWKEAAAQAARADALAELPVELRAGLAWVRAAALTAQARTSRAPAEAREAALAQRSFWLTHPDHPAAAAALEEEASLAALAGGPLNKVTGHELLQRASRLLSAGQPADAATQAREAAAALGSGGSEDAAEASLLLARALAADGRRNDATSALESAWAHGSARVASAAGLLLARDRGRRGRDAEAIRLLDELSRTHPAAPEAEEGALVAARLELDAGHKASARTRLAKLAALRHGANASLARWTLAWLSYRDHLSDAVERFAEFASSALSDEERAQGLYWQARAGKPELAGALFRRVVELDPLGWYGLLGRTQLGQASGAAVPFPPARSSLEQRAPAPGRLAVAEQLFQLGLRAEAAAQTDRFVQQHQGDLAGLVRALSVYERAGRFDRSVVLAQNLLAGHGPPHHETAASMETPEGRLRAVLSSAYPAAFPEQVGASARRANLDPYLLLSIMRRESLFRTDTRSAAGAVGLLQLLPATATRAAVVLGRPPLHAEDLVEPAVAIDLGAWYLSELLGRFGDPTIAVAAYNAGPRPVGAWAAKSEGQPLDAWVEEIPYRETRKYVRIVIGAWSAYRLLAGGAPPALTAGVPKLRAGMEF